MRGDQGAKRVIAIGECMAELALADGEEARIGYAGDTFNTAVYMCRLGRRVAYATALGRSDRFSRAILGLMAREGIESDLVIQVEGRLPGLYAIERDTAGERSFAYWRGEAPVRDYIRLVDLAALKRAILEAELVYLSGVSLAVIGADGREGIGAILIEAAARGVAVALDPNYRPQLWESPHAARSAIEALAPACSFLSFSSADAEPLFPVAAAELAKSWAASGAEVVRREEDRSVHVHVGHRVQSFAPLAATAVVDTTGAGDSFNAAYLTARLAGRPISAAVAMARRLSARVIAWPGAIIPRGLKIT